MRLVPLVILGLATPILSSLFYSFGLNCEGSTSCIMCKPLHLIWELIEYVDEKNTYVEGQKIACTHCQPAAFKVNDQPPGLCIFPQGLRKGDTITMKVVKEKVRRLMKHGCGICGHVPIYPGNDVNNGGMLACNYVRNSCLEGICGPIMGEAPPVHDQYD